MIIIHNDGVHYVTLYLGPGITTRLSPRVCIIIIPPWRVSVTAAGWLVPEQPPRSLLPEQPSPSTPASPWTIIPRTSSDVIAPTGCTENK